MIYILDKFFYRSLSVYGYMEGIGGGAGGGLFQYA